MIEMSNENTIYKQQTSPNAPPIQGDVTAPRQRCRDAHHYVCALRSLRAGLDGGAFQTQSTHMTHVKMDAMSARQCADAERRRTFLRELLKRNNMRPAELARRAGFPSTNAIYNFLNGRSASLSQATIEKIVAVFSDGSADALIIRPAIPTNNIPRNRQAPPGVVEVPVIAEARQGKIQPAAALPHTDPLTIWVPATLVQHRPRLFGVRVGRPGAEGLYPEGSLLICMGLPMLQPSLTDGQRVVVTRTHEGGVEVTVRRVQVHGSGTWLWPDCDDPRQQHPLLAPTPTTAQNGDITVFGKVIATLQPELSTDE
jgi:transcriptional regulator with XRE-family HTH domain